MSLTLIGIIVIILSIIAFIKDEDWLLGLVIFFSTFTAAAAIDIKATTTAIVPFEIPLVLWILKQVINFLKTKPKISIDEIKKIFRENKIFTALFIFTLIMLISEVWLLISGINYPYYDSLYLEDRVIKFSGANITQPARVLAFLVFAMILSLKIDDKEKIKKMLNIFSISTICAIAWGFVQFILYYLNIEYPDVLFNNNPYYAQCYDQVMHGIKRICSIGTEPSVFSLNLLAYLPIILIPWLFKQNAYEKRKRTILTIIVIATIVCAILTTSSTALVGLVVIMGVLLLYLLISGKKNKELEETRKNVMKIIGYSVLSILIAFFICIVGNKIANYENSKITIESGQQSSVVQEADFGKTLKEMTIAKLSSGSGQERTRREVLGFEIYINSPIFGVGFGSFRTFTLFTNVMVNMGIIGLLSLIYILVITIKTIIKNRKKDEMYAIMFLLSIIGMTVAFTISVPDLIYVYYWIIIVCAYKYFTIESKIVDINKDKESVIIGIDARGLNKNKTGIATYIDELVKQFNTLDNDKNEYILYSNREIKIDAELNKKIKIKTYNKPLGTFWVYFTLPKILKEDKVDVFWGTQHLLPMRNQYTKSIKYVVTVHDLAIHKLKNVGEWKNTLIQRLFLKTSCKNADKILAISKSTKRDIVDIFRIDANKIDVIYSGTNLNKQSTTIQEKEQDILEKFNVKDRNFLFFVSTIEPRKNIITLIKAFETIKEKDEKNTLKLILAGGLGWKYQEIIEAIDNSKYKQDINLAGYILKEEKECLLTNAKCFVYPSLYEGFGLPILEAMANEAIVVTSNVSSIPEVGEDAAFYFDDVKDYKELANVIEKVLNISEQERKEKIRQGIEQTKKFTWDKCAKETLRILTSN